MDLSIDLTEAHPRVSPPAGISLRELESEAVARWFFSLFRSAWIFSRQASRTKALRLGQYPKLVIGASISFSISTGNETVAYLTVVLYHLVRLQSVSVMTDVLYITIDNNTVCVHH